MQLRDKLRRERPLSDSEENRDQVAQEVGSVVSEFLHSREDTEETGYI